MAIPRLGLVVEDKPTELSYSYPIIKGLCSARVVNSTVLLTIFQALN